MNFSGNELLRSLSKVQRKKNENHRRVLTTSSIKREIREFHVVVVKLDGKEIYKKVCGTCSVFHFLGVFIGVGVIAA